MNEIKSLYNLTLPELTSWMQGQKEKPYRARQVFHALYRHSSDARAMKVLSKALRERLKNAFPSPPLESVEIQRSGDGTVKFLSKLPDGQLVETVLIPTGKRRTVCVSTQVGCAYACVFCASGQAGFKRNLSAGEIVQQVLQVQSQLKDERVSNVVFMGMGEPLSNYDNLVKAIRILNTSEGIALGSRKMTISTVGLVPMIERLTQEGMQFELAISLHAPNDTLRKKLIPVNEKYPLNQLIPACRAYAEKTKRLITFEYILIDQVNDGLEEARELAKLLSNVHAKINLIPYHPIPNILWKRPSYGRMLAFEKMLRQKKVRCSLRRSRGLDIDGACGQLRLRQEEALPRASAQRLRQEEILTSPSDQG